MPDSVFASMRWLRFSSIVHPHVLHAPQAALCCTMTLFFFLWEEYTMLKTRFK